MKNLICICCPIGCNLTVDDSDKNDIKVSGNACPRGKKYAVDEITAPKRMVTSVVPIKNGDIAMLSVKTSQAIPKEHIFDALKTLKGISVFAPVNIGDVIKSDVYGADFVATKRAKQSKGR